MTSSARHLTLRIEGYGGAFFATLKASNGTCWPVVADDGGRAFPTAMDAFKHGLETAKTIPGNLAVGRVEWPDSTRPVNSNRSCLILLLACALVAMAVSCLSR